MSRTANQSNHSERARDGFTLIQVAAFALLVGVVGVIGVPRWLWSSEQQKVEDAFLFLQRVADAQEQYRESHGVYQADLTALDIACVSPAYFTVEEMIINPQPPTWSLTLARCNTKEVFGHYHITFNQDGFDALESDVHTSLIPPQSAGR